MFAGFGHDGKSEHVFLTMTPLLDQGDDEEDPRHTADVHIDFLKTVLKDVKRLENSVLFLEGDNYAVNGSMSDKMGVPVVEYASHRLNLALARYLDDYENILGKVVSLMKALRKFDNAAKLIHALY
ncbi:hypothetical protein PRIC1_014875 [Phytophthora ramorum]